MRRHTSIAKGIENKAAPAIDVLFAKLQSLPDALSGMGGGFDLESMFSGVIPAIQEFANGWQMTNEQLGVFADYIRIAGVAIGLFMPHVGILIALATALYTAYEINFLGFADLVNSAVPIVKTAFDDIIGFFSGFISALTSGSFGDIKAFIVENLISPIANALVDIMGTDLEGKAKSLGTSTGPGARVPLRRLG